jgi:hypothetical protein
MPFVAWVPRHRYAEIAGIAEMVPIEISWTWNCQNWARGLLDGLVIAGLITEADRNNAYTEMHAAINTPFTTSTPNAEAVQDNDE